MTGKGLPRPSERHYHRVQIVNMIVLSTPQRQSSELSVVLQPPLNPPRATVNPRANPTVHTSGDCLSQPCSIRTSILHHALDRVRLTVQPQYRQTPSCRYRQVDGTVNGCGRVFRAIAPHVPANGTAVSACRVNLIKGPRLRDRLNEQVQLHHHVLYGIHQNAIYLLEQSCQIPRLGTRYIDTTNKGNLCRLRGHDCTDSKGVKCVVFVVFR